MYLVGNAEMGDYYHFPQDGVRILTLLASGHNSATIKSTLVDEQGELVDVDGFIELLSSIGFIRFKHQTPDPHEQLQAPVQDSRRIFDVDPNIAGIFCSPAVFFAGLGVTAYATLAAIHDPTLRLNINAFYIETNRTSLLLIIMILAFMQVVMHEVGHMLAAARHGIKSKYGIGHRLWTIVAESDLTGILSLPKAQRYIPMLAGLFVDIVCASVLTIILQLQLHYGVSAFTTQVIQALVLEIIIGIVWQFNIFMKTDIYFVICNYFSHPDLDRDARLYLRALLYTSTMGLFGIKSPRSSFRDLNVVRVFAAIWFVGRTLLIPCVVLCIHTNDRKIHRFRSANAYGTI